MHNDNLDRSLRAAMGDVRATPAAEAAFDAAFAAIAEENAQTSPALGAAPAPRRRPATPSFAPRWARAAAVACAVCLGVGGTAYAADALGLIDLRPSGAYQTMMAVETGDAASSGPVEDYRLEFSGLPTNARASDADDHMAKYQWGEGADEKGFSALVFYLDSNEALPVSFTTGSTPVAIGSAEGVIFEKSSAYYNETTRDMYLVFPDQQRVLWLWSDSLGAEELTAVAEGASLAPTGTKVVPGAESGLATWSDEIAQGRAATEEGEGEPLELHLTASAEEMDGLHAAGEAFAVPCYAEQTWDDVEGHAGALTATVASVAVRDDLSTLSAADVPEEWKALVGADSALGNAEVRHIAFGDGRESIDEVVATESLPMKLVEINVEYRNTGETALDDTLVYGSLLRATESEGTWAISDRASAQEGSDVAVCDVPGVTDGEMRYYAIDEAHRGEKNHLSHLEPGETATVQLAWIVPADELDKLLLSLSGGGSDYEFAAEDLAVGYVDIRQ